MALLSFHCELLLLLSRVPHVVHVCEVYLEQTLCPDTALQLFLQAEQVDNTREVFIHIQPPDNSSRHTV